MHGKEINLDCLFKARVRIDSRLLGTLGTCELFGGAIEIDTGIKSPTIQEALLEHETTHRADITTTHFGNIYNLINSALRCLENFPPTEAQQVLEISKYFLKSRFIVCFEGRATFNERLHLPYIAEEQWIEALRNRDDQSYYDGYTLTCRIMNKFRIEKWVLPYLSDTLIVLPLCVEWYKHFSSIQSACEYMKSLDSGGYPSSRLAELANLLDEIGRCNPRAIKNFCSEVRESLKEVYTKALKKRFDEVTCIRDGSFKSWRSPTGTEVCHFLQKMIAKHLKEILLQRGFDYADQWEVPEINRIVRCWNKEIETGKPSIPEFQIKTGIGAQCTNIQFVPIGRKRAIDAIRPEGIKDKIRSVLANRSDAYFLARLHQVWQERGWQMDKNRVLPFGAWYFVLAIRYSDIHGQAVFYVTSPDFAGVVRFAQFYYHFTSAENLIDELSVDLPRTLWLLPSPNAYRYSLQPSLRQDLLRVIEQVQMNMWRESDCYCVLAENSIDEILSQLVRPCPTRCLYNDDSHLWRLWRTEGSRKRVFVTPKGRNLHRFLQALLEDRGIRCETGTSVHDGYLLQWLGSGEGF